MRRSCLSFWNWSQSRKGFFCSLRLSRKKSLFVRVSDKKEFALIKAEHFRQSRDNQVGRVPHARFQVAHIWRRNLDFRSEFSLREIQLSSPAAYHLAEVRFISALSWPFRFAFRVAHKIVRNSLPSSPRLLNIIRPNKRLLDINNHYKPLLI